MTDTATTLIVETPKVGNPELCYTIRRYRASRPVTLAEVWDEFAKPGRPKPIVTMAKGTARVTF